jgi:hypothetical protein
MNIQKPPAEKSGLEKAIDRVLEEMDNETVDSEPYAQMVDQLAKLHALKTVERQPRISPDTVATIIANLAGIVIIVGHERVHIVTSKALSFIMKLR